MKRTKIPGIYKRLNEIDPFDFLTYDGMRDIFDCDSDDTINAAVDRGELPPPIRQMGNNMWLGLILHEYIKWRAQSAVAERLGAQAKVKELYPRKSV